MREEKGGRKKVSFFLKKRDGRGRVKGGKNGKAVSQSGKRRNAGEKIDEKERGNPI